MSETQEQLVWVSGQFNIHTVAGWKTILGLVSSDRIWGIDIRNDEQCAAITHLATGCRVGFADTVEEAMDAVAEIRMLADFASFKERQTGKNPELKEQIEAILEKYNRKDAE